MQNSPLLKNHIVSDIEMRHYRMSVLLRTDRLEIAENMTWLGQFKYQWYVNRQPQLPIYPQQSRMYYRIFSI